jgi:hypothetical protein
MQKSINIENITLFQLVLNKKEKDKYYLYLMNDDKQLPKWQYKSTKKDKIRKLNTKSLIKKIGTNKLKYPYLYLEYKNINSIEQKNNKTKLLKLDVFKNKIIKLEITNSDYLDSKLFDIKISFSNNKTSNRELSNIFFWDDNYDNEQLTQIKTLNILNEKDDLLTRDDKPCDTCPTSISKNLKQTVNKISKVLNKVGKKDTFKRKKTKKKLNTRTLSFAQIGEIIKKLKNDPNWILKDKKGKPIYNPFADPQSPYYMGIYLCSTALASLEPGLEFCNSSPAYAVAPPQGF